MLSTKQIVGIILFIVSAVVFIVAHQAKKRYMKQLQELVKEESEEHD